MLLDLLSLEFAKLILGVSVAVSDTQVNLATISDAQVNSCAISVQQTYLVETAVLS